MPDTARAQASPLAENLFRDGKRLMKDGRFAEACSAFEGSERAEHNIATTLSLADCKDKNHQYASAWALFLQADSQTRSDPSKAMLNATAKSRARALERRLSFLTIVVPEKVRIPELVVTCDGAPVDPSAWNRSIPVDGGPHVISDEAPGYEAWSTTVTLEPSGDRLSVELSSLKKLPARFDERRHEDHKVQPLTTKRQVAIAAAAAGLAAAGIGIYFGLDERSLRGQALATCPPSDCSSSAAVDAQAKNDRARGRALYANIGFGIASAAIVTSGVLWLLGAPVSQGTTIAMAPQLGHITGLMIMRRF